MNLELFLAVFGSAAAALAYWLLRQGRVQHSTYEPPTQSKADYTRHMPDTFVVFDLETTGLNEQADEIIEIGAIRYKSGRIVHETFSRLIRPAVPIPKRITEITSITQSMIDKDGIGLAEAVKDFLEFVGNDRLVAYNAPFDMKFLRAAVKQLGFPKVANPVSDALEMVREAVPGLPSYKLGEVAKSLGITPGTAHRALGDAETTLLIYALASHRLESVD